MSVRIDARRRHIARAVRHLHVLIEWILRADCIHGTQADWLYLHDEILDQGYAYVGVTTQYIGVQSLRGWESGPGARYADLFHPGDSYDYNIFAQVGWVVAHPRKGDARPLGNRLLAGRSFHLQPDSTHVRVWKFAGATHLETSWFKELAADSIKSIPGFSIDPCDGPPGIPGLVHGQASRAALHAGHLRQRGSTARRASPWWCRTRRMTSINWCGFLANSQPTLIASAIYVASLARARLSSRPNGEEAIGVLFHRAARLLQSATQRSRSRCTD